jgi:putative DNA primase/helicase
VTDDTSAPHPPEGNASPEEWRAWIARQQEELAADERRAAGEVEAWRVTYMDAARQWDERAAAARRCAELGLPVIRLPGLDYQSVCVCTNSRWMQRPRESCPAPGRHPDYGYRAVAESDPEFAAALFRPREQDCRVVDGETAPVPGVGTVLFAGEYVEIDIDRHDRDGFRTLAILEAELGPLPDTLTVATPRSGEHRIFLDPRRDDPELYFRAGEIAPGIDLICNGQSTPVPPTRTPRGSYVLLRDVLPARLPQAWAGHLHREPLPVRAPGERREIPEGSLPVLRAWVMAAVTGEAQRLAAAGSGRNTALNLAAFRLGQIAAACEGSGQPDALPEDAAYDHLIGACDLNGYITEHGLATAAATFQSGWHGGLRQPRTDLPASLFSSAVLRTRDDFGLADRLFDYAGDRILFSSEFKGWLIYERGRWQRQRNPVVEGLVRVMVEQIPEEIPESEDNEASGRVALLAWAYKQRSHSVVSRTLGIAETDEAHHAVPEEFDRDPMLLNVANGIIDLRTGELLPHDPAARMMLQSPVSYDPDARAPMWDEIFLQIIMPDQDCRAYLSRLTGYSLTGSIEEQAMALHHGTGKNGKSVYLQVCAALLGSYAQSVPAATILKKGAGDRIPNDIARMKGRRFLQVSETAEGKRMDEEVIKSLTGGEMISARFLHAEFFDFTPTGKIHFITNNLPDMSNDAAIWRRIHFVPWDIAIPEERQDKTLAATLVREEGPGILNWAVRGCLDWQRQGLAMPLCAETRLLDYREDQDYLGQFLTLRTEDKEGERTLTSVLYQAYRAWNLQTGHKEMSEDTFSKRLAARGYERYRTMNGRGFTGIALRTP